MKPKNVTNSRIIALTLLVAILMSSVGCCGGGGSTPELITVSASCDDLRGLKHISREVDAAVGDSITVSLCSNRSTGFGWSESAQISDQSMLQQTEHNYLAPEREKDKPPALGASGKQVWTFEALKKGTGEVSMDYGQPWEGGEKGAWTFDLTVVVK